MYAKEKKRKRKMLTNVVTVLKLEISIFRLSVKRLRYTTHSLKIKVGSGNDGGCVVSLLGAKVKELGENKKVRWGQHVVLMFGCSCMPI